MSLVIYNTLSRDKEPFAPLDAGHVRLYVCGPTVYDYVHIGNARPVVVFDVLYRLLKRRYPRVTYVRNITDIDDRIMVRAADNGETIDALTARTAGAYQSDMLRLGALAPDVEPRATAVRRRHGRHDPAPDRQRPCLCRRRPCAVQRPQHERLRPPVAPHARRAGRRRARRGRAVQEGPRRLRAVEAFDATTSRAGRARGAAAGPAGTSSARR